MRSEYDSNTSVRSSVRENTIRGTFHPAAALNDAPPAPAHGVGSKGGWTLLSYAGEPPVTYRYRLQDLFALLQPRAEATNVLAADHRRVQHGLLSVGLKIHCLDNGQQFHRLIEGLGGAAEVLERQPL